MPYLYSGNFCLTVDSFKMKIDYSYPATIYSLNTLASLLARAYARKPDPPEITHHSISEHLLRVTKDSTAIPLTPKNDQHSLLLFDQYIGNLQLQSKSSLLDASLRRDINRTLTNLSVKAKKQKVNNKFSIQVDVIAKSLGIPNLWNICYDLIKTELTRFGKFNEHPEIDQQLNRKISNVEILKWFTYVSAEVLQTGISLKDLTIYRSKFYQKRYLMWSINQQGIEYCVPEFLTYAHFFSWDCPHNLAHLLHLSALHKRGKGADGYIDTPQQRSYFESVAVYAEHLMLQFLLDKDSINGNKAFRDWLVRDRGHEFLLRLIRLMGDYFSIMGMEHSDIIAEIHRMTNVHTNLIENEVNRYYAYCGLGSVYTVGYLNHCKTNIKFDQTIFTDDSIITEWPAHNC